jgi:hypothetical protein
MWSLMAALQNKERGKGWNLPSWPSMKLLLLAMQKKKRVSGWQVCKTSSSKTKNIQN